jgi:hypothetical protein
MGDCLRGAASGFTACFAAGTPFGERISSRERGRARGESARQPCGAKAAARAGRHAIVLPAVGVGESADGAAWNLLVAAFLPALEL